jgi:hypothetical protein
MRKATGCFAALVLGTVSSFAHADEHSEKNDSEHHFITLEIGGAGEWSFRGESAYGHEAGLEFTVVEHWLEIELAVMPLLSKDEAEIGTEIIFKIPFELSKSLEFYIGAGPEWVHISGNEGQRDLMAGVALVEFVYSPWPDSPIAIFVAPSYVYNFSPGHEQSIEVTAGLHVGIE